MKKQITGLNHLNDCPPWVQWYWEASLDADKVDKVQYNEMEDYQVFIFSILDTEEEVFPDLRGLSFVKLWELPEGQISYEAYAP